MVEIIFKGGKIQTGFRIKIPKPLIDTLNLKAGQNVLLKFDADKNLIIIEPEVKVEKNKNLDKGKDNIKEVSGGRK